MPAVVVCRVLNGMPHRFGLLPGFILCLNNIYYVIVFVRIGDT